MFVERLTPASQRAPARRAATRAPLWLAWGLPLALGVSAVGHAQDMGGMGGMGGPGGMDAGGAGGAPPAGAGLSQAPMTGGNMTGGGMRGGGSAGSPGGAPSASPDALFGLRPSDAPATISLEDALQLAATQSFDLRIAREKVVQQELQVQKAWAMLLPNLNAGGNYTFNCIGTEGAPFLSCDDQTISFASEEQLDQQKLLFSSLGEILRQVAGFEQDPARQAELGQRADQLFDTADEFERAKGDIQPIVVQPAHVVTGNLTLSMPLFNGRAWPLLQNAQTAVEAVDLAGNQARAALLFAVARAYYGAYTTRRMWQASREQLASAEAHRSAVTERVALNAASPLVLRRADLDVIRAEQGVRAAESAYRLAIGGLGNLIGVQTFFDVGEPPPQVAIESEHGVDQLLSLAYQARPDLRAQKLALTIADRNRVEAWMQFLPSFNLVAQGRATSNVNGFVATPFTGAVMVTASVPLYDGGTRYVNLKETASRIREELLRVRQLEYRIEGQVRGNVSDLSLKAQALGLAREAVAVAQQTRDQAQSLYDVGAATPLDVSDANLAVYFAEMDLLRAELDLQQARLGLAYTVGAFPGALDVSANSLADDEAAQARARLMQVK